MSAKGGNDLGADERQGRGEVTGDPTLDFALVLVVVLVLDSVGRARLQNVKNRRLIFSRRLSGLIA
jgi:hypothetical protein